MGNLKGYVESYIEHSNKIVQASGDPTKVYAIRGWINDCRHFAEKAYDQAQKHLRNGEKVTTESGDNLDANDIHQRFGNRME